MTNRLYEMFAQLLTYPRTDYHAYVRECAARATVECSRDIVDFLAIVRSMKLENVQEAYSALFELNPSCTLDLGWHLFGEKHERGLLLARMRRELERHGIVETGQLPDNLTNALRLLAAMKRGEAEDFAGAIVLPALAKIVSTGETHQPFGRLLAAVNRFLCAEYSNVTFDEPTSALPVITEAAV